MKNLSGLPSATLPAAMPILEAGMMVLYNGGFGNRSSFAYAALFNNAMLTISLSDDRLQHEDDGPRDHATMMSEFDKMPSASPRARDLAHEFIRPFAGDNQQAAHMRWTYYDFIVSNTVSGLETGLSTGSNSRSINQRA